MKSNFSFTKKIQSLSILVALLIFVLTLPFVFVGVDFTDFGYHYINQIDFGIWNGTIRNTCYFWLSDFISGIFVHLFGSTYMALKLSGVVIWSVLALFASKYFLHQLKPFPETAMDRVGWVLLLVGGFLLSGSSLGQGSTLVGDYYVVPTIFVFSIYTQSISCLHSKVSNRKLLVIFILTILLPLLRWPLFITSLFTLASLMVLSRLTSSQKKFGFLFTFLFLIICYLYSSYFLIPTLGMSRANSVAVGNILSANLNDLKAFSMLSLWTLAAYFTILVLRILKNLTGILFYALSISSFFALLITIFFLYETSFYVFRGDLWYYSAHCIYFFSIFFILTRLFNKRTTIDRREREVVIFSLLMFALYGVGSNNGFMKSGYFSFIPLIFAFRYLLAHVHRKTLAFAVSILVFALGLIQFHRASYRDDLSAIVNHPEIISNSVLGFQITQPRTFHITSDLTSLLSRHPDLINVSAVTPSAPLLNGYLKNVDKTVIFLSIKHATQRLDWIRQAYEKGGIRYLIQANVSLADPHREQKEDNPYEPSCVLPKYNSEFFRVIDVQCLLK